MTSRLTVRRAPGILIAVAVALSFWPASAPAQVAEDSFDLKDQYDKTRHMIPMRDGVELYTIVYTPRDADRTYPVLLYRTPYSIAPYGAEEYPDRLGPTEQFDRDGYIFVFQDVRGKYGSEGDFEVIEPLWTHLPGSPVEPVDESTDTWDTIEWLMNNLDRHNGRVGQWGISYSAWETVMGMVDAHPALKAASPQASPSDMFIGDDWHHNGTFRLMYAFYWLSFNASTVEAGAGEEPERFDYGTPWGYRFFLEGGSADRIAQRYFGENTPPAWDGFIEHPDYDEYWKRKNTLRYLHDVGDLPVLNVAGWFDAEDFYGPMSIYRTIEEENPENRNSLVVGPWRHGGWSREAGDHLGCIDFGSATSEYYQREALYPFFTRHLAGETDDRTPEVVAFETGGNRWHEYDAWPPATAESRRLYLQDSGALSFRAPEGGSSRGRDTFVSDPAKPVPFSSEIRVSQGHDWKVEDQRFASTRPDVLVYQTTPLEEDVTVAGDIVAHLRVATTGEDADWAVKLIDVYPGDAPDSEFCDVPMGDFQMLVAGDIMRGRYRNSYSEPEPMSPGEITEVEFSLRDKFHTFRKGHRIMVQIQSTWFPVYDRNPQTWVPNIYRARSEDYEAQTHSVYRSAEHPSFIELPVLETGR